MAMLIREYLGSPVGLKENSIAPLSLTEGKNSLDTISKDSLMVDIEGIHVGPTRNFTWYTEEALKSSIPTWTKPYERPLILHHNEKDGKIIGRVLAANYTNMNTRSKTGALVFTCNVPDEEGKQGIRDGRLKTVSIGVIAHDVRCSICGHVISEYGECEHERGMIYDGETCYWMVHDMEAKELSYVIVPSDIYAHNIRIYSPVDNKQSMQEGVQKVNTNTELKESAETIIIEDADKKEETKVAEVKSAESKEEVKEESKEESKEDDKVEESIESLKTVIDDLSKTVKELTAELETAKAQVAQANELQKAAEDELVAANNQLKEFAVDQVMMLREQLGRTALLRENLLKRSNESIMDSIADLKEEMGSTTAKAVDLTESTEVTETPEEVPATEELAKIEKPLTESLVDEEKDSSAKKEDKSEKISGLDVKESEQISNIDYDTTLAMMSKFYNL